MQLSDSQIKNLIKNYDIGNFISFKKTEKGVVNHNLVITTTKGKFILRCAHKDRKINELLFEHEFLRQLKSHNFPYKIPYPHTANNRKSIVKFKGRYFWLYDFIEGSTLLLNKEKIKQVARMMATMHRIVPDIKIKPKKKRPNPSQIGWLIKSLKKSKIQAIKKRNKDEKDIFYIKNSDRIISILKSLKFSGYSSLPRMPIHSDINYENILFRKGKLVGIIDFDNWQIDTRINDITAFIAYECRNLNRKNGLDLSLLKAFFNEYRKYNKISRKEIRFIPVIAASLYSDAFWWCYHILETDPYRKYSIKSLRKAFKAANIFYENREEIEELLLRLV